MVAYITKNFLTNGIIELEGDIISNGVFQSEDGLKYKNYEWWQSKEEAEEYCNAKINKQIGDCRRYIKTINARINKLQQLKLQFTEILPD
jgi:hypothetical protein